MKIITLIENEKLNLPNLKAEHGISLYVENNGKKLLFDVGCGINFLNNAKALNISVEEIDYLIISHGHNDHGGGLKWFLDNNKKAKIIMKKTAIENYYLGFFGLKFNCSLDRELIDNNMDRFILVDSDYSIDEDMRIIANIERVFDIPITNNYLYKLKGNRKVPDDFKHELIFTVRCGEKIVIFSGCGHSGILNIVETVKSSYGHMSKLIIIGGFHLRNPIRKNSPEAAEQIISIGDCLANDESIVMIYTGHCTGEKAYRILKEKLKDRIGEFHTGQVIDI